MNDTVATEDQEQPAKKHERKLASMIGIPVVGLVWGSFRQVKSQGITRPLFLTKAVGAGIMPATNQLDLLISITTTNVES